MKMIEFIEFIESLPDGEFTLPDGSTRVVVDGERTEIVEPEPLQADLGFFCEFFGELKYEIKLLSEIRRQKTDSTELTESISEMRGEEN